MNKTYIIKNKINYSAIGDIEVSEQEIRNLLKENPELLTPTPKRKYFVPKLNEMFYFIRHDNSIGDMYNNTDTAEQMIKQGNCFATEQDAQDELNRRQALVRIWNNYDDKYSWDIDWKNDEQIKYYIIYDFEDNKIGEDMTCIFHESTELPYFKSAEDRNQFVEDNMEDLLTIFNIKNKIYVIKNKIYVGQSIMV